MKGSPVLTIASALLIAIFVTNVPQSESALTAAQTCAITQNNTYIGDPKSCQGWNFCINGQVAHSGNCGNGLMYDVPSGECDYASEVQCNTNVTTMCVGETNIYKADPTSCQNYCYCKNGVASCQACPKGQYFDSSITQCVWQADSTCLPNSPCALSKNGFVQGVDCTTWIRCFNGQQADSGSCADGLLYNVNTGICDYSANVKCSSPGPPSPGPSNNAPKATATTCKGVTTADTYVSGLTAKTDSCRGFFVCAGATATGAVYGVCPLNTHFNPTKLQCNDPNQVACAGNRCDGVNKKWMAAVNTACKQYTACTNGKQGTPVNCNSAYPYFNEEEQACQTTQPQFPICLLTATAI